MFVDRLIGLAPGVVSMARYKRFTLPDFHNSYVRELWKHRFPTAFRRSVKVEGTDAEKGLAFHQTYGALRNRMTEFTALPIAALDRISLQKAVDEIGQSNEEGMTK